MIAALLLAAAVPQTAIDAERAFAAAAQAEGQWTAFRRYAAPEAVMFAPQPVNAQAWLKDRKDPPRSVRWQPALSFVSCDGRTAVNTGPWQRADGSVGYFTTVWRRSGGRWHWLLDFGDALPKAAPAPKDVAVTAASCQAAPGTSVPLPSGVTGGGSAADGTLRWWYTAASGRRTLAVDYWDGRSYHATLADQVDPERPAKP